jgi:hypothetical protein
MEQQQSKQTPLELSSQLVSIMTTEHYNLQTGRSIATAETNGRSALFVGAVSSGLIALTFVGQIAQLGPAFFAFGLVVIPTLLFMGLITFDRVVQAGSLDFIYARGISRIRHLYLEYAPQMQSYFINSTQTDPSLNLSTHDGQGGTSSHQAMHVPKWQLFLSTAGMIAVINSVLAGSFLGLLLAAFAFPLWVPASAGIAPFLLSVFILQRYQWQQWVRLTRAVPDLFANQRRP